MKLLHFHVNLVNFYREQSTVTLIQHMQHSKNRLCAEMIAALLQPHRSWNPLPDRNRMQCECSDPLTWVRKKIRIANALQTEYVWIRRETWYLNRVSLSLSLSLSKLYSNQLALLAWQKHILHCQSMYRRREHIQQCIYNSLSAFARFSVCGSGWAQKTMSRYDFSFIWMVWNCLNV